MLAYSAIIQTLKTDSNHHVDILRLDLLHNEISGNKWFKLKHNLEKVVAEKHKLIVTFGGAFSNHIAATAAACKLFGIKSVGVIRGEETTCLNPTLQKAKDDGMHLHFVSRELYTQKNNENFKAYLNEKFGVHYLIPEGGNNEAGAIGCMEILNPDWDYDYILCACGTGTTFWGLVASIKANQTVIGISVLKGENKLANETEAMLKEIFSEKKIEICGNEELEKRTIENHCISNRYCFSGYAKFDKPLIEFKNDFEKNGNIPLDYVYTNKLFFAAFDLMKSEKLRPSSKILIIHSGGLQGNKGFEERYHLMLKR